MIVRTLDRWPRPAAVDGLFDVLEAAGASVRFIGGCVRDAVLGRPAGDIDLATDAPAPRVMDLLGAAGVKAVPTGLAHGTVTAVADGEPVQITTLRRDVSTDGRRATVAYTADWAEDAARRDLTMNALSADRDGNVHDYVGGLGDLEAGRVRFIGNAADRIAEDHLRILRFFRFHAWYARGAADAGALAACAAASGLVDRLSGERLWHELCRTLTAPDPGTVFAMMDSAGVLERLLPVARRPGRIAALAALERGAAVDPEPLRRLASLVDASEEEAARFCRRLRMSRAETARLEALIARRGAFLPPPGDAAARRLLYDAGPALFADLLLLDRAGEAARDPDSAARHAAAWDDLARTAREWREPRFPLGGRDAARAGLDEGPGVGECLAAVEEWWMDNCFAPDRAACLDRLRKVAEEWKRGRPEDGARG